MAGLAAGPGAGLVAALAALALLVAYLLGTAGADVEAAAASGTTTGTTTGPAATGTLVMVGTGRVETVPDALSFRLGVVATRLDLEAALDHTSRVLRRVLATLDGYGVSKRDVQTTGLSMNPVYDYSGDTPVLTGYRVSQRAQVEVPELRQGGRAIAASVRAGGNAVRVSDVRLVVSDPAGALAEARAAAVEDARTKAEQYADAAGETLAEVASLRDLSSSGRSPVVPMALGAADAVRASVPIRAGRSDQTVRVQVVWKLG